MTIILLQSYKRMKEKYKGEGLEQENVSLPKSFVEALNGETEMLRQMIQLADSQ